jgi:hypothetical protein
MKLIVSAIVALGIAGCASQEEAALKYQTTPSMQLCVDYMTLPTINIYQEARAREIERRGVDCSQYADIAAARANANSGSSVNCTSTQSGNQTHTTCH